MRATAETETLNPLLIFDCDGVLVDSEPISIVVLVESLKTLGVAITQEEAYSLFLGRSLSAVGDYLRLSHGLHMHQAFLDDMRQSLYDRFRADLQPLDGAGPTLAALPYRRCVASSSQLERIRLSLTLTGLISHFEPNIFSSSMVTNGKPAPDLFLYAANTMGVEPKDCIVIEDSPAGVMAAQAAGMKVLLFTGGTHTRNHVYRKQTETLEPDGVFDAFADLLHLVPRLGKRT